MTGASVSDRRGKRDLVTEAALEFERSLGNMDTSVVMKSVRRQSLFDADILAAGLAGASASLSLATALGAQSRISRSRSGTTPPIVTTEERKKEKARAARKRQRQARRAGRRAA